MIGAAMLGLAAIQASAAPAGPCCTIPAETVVQIEVVEAVGSRRSRTGDRFAIRLAEPIVVDQRTLVPVGAPGVGEVVHAARATGGIMPGELILVARYLEHRGTRIGLRGLRFAQTGADGRMTFVSGFPSSYFRIVGGRNVEVPVGAILRARVAGAVLMPAD